MPTALPDTLDAGPRRPPPLPRPDAARVWAGFVLVVAGVVLIGLGGGALAGILELLRMRRQSAHEVVAQDDAIVLQNVLYGLAAACFATAAVVLFLAIRGLYRIMQQRPIAEDMP